MLIQHPRPFNYADWNINFEMCLNFYNIITYDKNVHPFANI